MKKTILLMGASALMISAFGVTTAFAQDETVTEDQIVVTGTRRKARSAAETVAPVDVITQQDLVNRGATEMTDVIRLAVPSYNVNRQPINDASTLIRPACRQTIPWCWSIPSACTVLPSLPSLAGVFLMARKARTFR